MLEGNVQKHAPSYSSENARATLTWGKGFKDLGTGQFDPQGEYDYLSIEIVVDADNEVLTISGEQTFRFDKDGWKDLKKVENALAQAYVDPKRHYPYSPGDDTDPSQTRSDQG